MWGKPGTTWSTSPAQLGGAAAHSRLTSVNSPLAGKRMSQLSQSTVEPNNSRAQQQLSPTTAGRVHAASRGTVPPSSNQRMRLVATSCPGQRPHNLAGGLQRTTQVTGSRTTEGKRMSSAETLVSPGRLNDYLTPQTYVTAEVAFITTLQLP